ncbi:MAG: DUF1295 domain-containing protein [Deltaproteobacteria bacterium]|nr:DUF1295 domain-containing protein [Deltaproteobacteria bacterium]
MNPYLGMALHVLGFSVWSSLWPRPFIKSRLEPLMGWVGYRFFYNFGVIFLFGASILYLVQKGPETAQLWNFRGEPWFKPLIYILMGLVMFFLAGVAPMGRSFWGLGRPPEKFTLIQSGMYRITRHPLYVAVFLCLVAKTLVFGNAAALIWSVGLLAYNIIGVWVFETPSVRAQWGEEFDTYQKRVHWFPFVSILMGKEKFVWDEMPRRAFAVLAICYLGIVLLHDTLVWLTHILPRLGYVTGWFADKLF